MCRFIQAVERRAGMSGFAIACFALLALAGCRQAMDDQPRYDPLEPSERFGRITSARHLVAGTVPRDIQGGEVVVTDPAYITGEVGGRLVDQLPQRLLENRSMSEILERGQERYTIFCVHCHDLTGRGNGMVPRRGFPYPPTFHSRRLREVPIGHFFVVITNGLGRMPDHGRMIPVDDRWAIAAYIRALQFSQYAPPADLPESDRRQLPERNE